MWRGGFIMAIFRSVQVSFWQDDFVIELTPEEKFFYIYLMTNSKTKQCGIFSLPKRLIELETGYNRDTVDKLLKRFIEYGKILYSKVSGEIMIINWIKYNFINSKSTICCINKELKEAKDKELIYKLYEECKKCEYPVDLIFKDIDMPYEDEENKNRGPIGGHDGAPTPLGEKEKQKEKEILNKKIKEKEKEVLNKKIKEKNKKGVVVDLSDVIEFFNNNVHLITPHEFERLKDWSYDVDCEVILMAVKESVNQNKRTISYINGILNNWLSLGLTTGEKLYNYRYKKAGDKESKASPFTINSDAYRYVD